MKAALAGVVMLWTDGCIRQKSSGSSSRFAVEQRAEPRGVIAGKKSGAVTDTAPKCPAGAAEDRAAILSDAAFFPWQGSVLYGEINIYSRASARFRAAANRRHYSHCR